MYPIISLSKITISTYALLVLCGIFAAGIYACRTAKKQDLDENDMLITLLLASIGVVAGGSLLYGLLNFPYIIRLVQVIGRIDGTTFLGALYEVFGGSVFYGGLLGGLAVGALHLRRKKLPMGSYADCAAPAIPLFHAFGRIGCFFAGCCYGVESPFGVTFHHALIHSANGVSRFPVQLAEAAFNLALFFLLAWLLQHEKLKNYLLFLYLGLYAAGRFCLEFLRGDAYRGLWFWGLSTSQIISVALLCLTAFVLLVKQKKAKPSKA